VAVAPWAHLRLKDRIEPGVRVLFVGINPGVRSNRFWKLLSESRLVPEPITYAQDHRLPEFGFGITNLIARPSPGIDDLEPAEYLEGWKILARKIRRYRPPIVALVGVTLYRAIASLLVDHQGLPLERPTRGPRRAFCARWSGTGSAIKPLSSPIGRQRAVVPFGPRARGTPAENAGVQTEGARLFVLPNPSGRNANFTYAQMLGAFQALRRELARQSPVGPGL
jgi:TDG/mug DNA glycosylase family protein